MLRSRKTPWRNTPIVSLPSPFQSPHTGTSPERPNVVFHTSAPAAFLLMIAQVPFRNHAGVSTPSPSQSHASTCAPAGPNLNDASATPVVRLLRKYTRARDDELGEDDGVDAGAATPVPPRPCGSCNQADGT